MTGRVVSLLFALAAAAPAGATPDPPLGVGIVRPPLGAGQVLYFYGIPGADSVPGELVPFDSLVIRQGPHAFEIESAPPWFVPEVLKLDYDLLYLRAQTLTRYWIEVVVNRRTGETRWVERSAVTFTEWTTFLLDVVAVDVLEPEANPIRSGPSDETPVLSTMPVPLRPLAIQGDWMQVSTAGLADRIVPTGWIRWRDADRLLVAYAPLS